MLDPSYQQLTIQLHVFATVFMTGVVWHLQVVHFPSLRFISADQEKNAAHLYRKRTGWMVMPLMLIELGTAILLIGSSWVMQYGNYLWINLALLLFILGVTFLKMMPLHRQLALQMNDGIIQSLVAVNWIRTSIWSVRSVLLLGFLG